MKIWIRWLLPAILLITPLTSIAASGTPEQIGSTSYLPSLLNNYCTGTRSTSNPIGLQVYGATGYDQPYFHLLQDSYTSWVRNDIGWYRVERENVTPSQYDWTVADRVLRTAGEHCSNLIVTIHGTPAWATIDNGQAPFKPELLPEFVEFVGAVVERYDGDGKEDAPGSLVVNYWEFYNEPDASPSPVGNGWGLHGERYAEMLEAVYPVVKKANPNAKVVFGGISYDNFEKDGGIFVREFLSDVLEAGGGRYFDIMNFHYYPFHKHRKTWTQSNSSGLVEKIAKIQDELATYDLTKQLMITELGWHSNTSNHTPSSEEYQGRYIVQLATQAVAADVVALIWWPLIDSLNYPFKSGLVTRSYTAKSSYAVYVEAVKRIGTASNVHVIVPATETSDLEVYESREAGSGRKQYIAWLNPVAPFNAAAVASFDDTVSETWHAPGSVAKIYSKEGTLIETLLDEDDGLLDNSIAVQVGRSPIYILIQ